MIGRNSNVNNASDDVTAVVVPRGSLRDHPSKV